MNTLAQILSAAYIVGFITFVATGHDPEHTLLWPVAAYQNIVAGVGH